MMQENENEKKKIGLFGKLKNILFVDDESIDDTKEEPILPDYKNKIEEKKEEVVVKEVKEEPQTVGSRLNNDLKEISSAIEKVIEEEKEEPVKEEVKVEKESPFFSFDEEEFKRSISRVARSEAREKENLAMPAVKNNTYNTVSNNKPTKYDLPSSVVSSVNSSAHPGRKPFVPSPVISPVYGILDKNYSKEDIVDKRTDRRAKAVDNLDRVRTKAFGAPNVEETKTQEVKPLEEKEEVIVNDILEEKEANVIDTTKIVETKEEVEIPNIDSKPLDKIDDDTIKYSSPIEEELNNMINNNDEEELVNEEETNGINRNAKLDDLEKTSTLKILDDIEKELNSITPISEEVSEENNDKNDQTVEKDIFDMISSMYEGDEEDDSD
jgi:hypothetical protein